MSGLDYMRAVLEGRFPQPAIAGTLGYRLYRVEPGRVAFRGAPAFAHTNPMGAVHGGWYGTLLDSALGCAVMTDVPKGRWYTTLEYKVNLIRAIPLGLEIEAEAKVSHAGRTTAVAEATIWGLDDGRLYAIGSTTCLILGG
ncbi:MAG: PaaI family thioesterase [Paracoccaceae bacterium]|nr:PaaI family thioesterase [Paracoccaceae bacterium]